MMKTVVPLASHFLSYWPGLVLELLYSDSGKLYNGRAVHHCCYTTCKEKMGNVDMELWYNKHILILSIFSLHQEGAIFKFATKSSSYC